MYRLQDRESPKASTIKRLIKPSIKPYIDNGLNIKMKKMEEEY